ncbi:MAG: helix-turn-helix transcriptional regulator, partial [Gammaproteobacteria bacterium]|nr:helix-turn-helix transcriptional regulator [Gammaproteobacteria bacterium]
MILADKIVKLRKQFGWSQEELAEKMNVSRQSVSKWESTNSIPDLNRIIILTEIFGVSTDFLLKDEVEAEAVDSLSEGVEPGLIQISLEQALEYVDNKMEASGLIAKGVALSVCSVIPLFFLLAIAETEPLNLTKNVAIVIGILSILAMVSFGISFFIKINQYESDLAPLDNERFELTYGVHSVFKEKLQKFTKVYNQRLTAGISM